MVTGQGRTFPEPEAVDNDFPELVGETRPLRATGPELDRRLWQVGQAGPLSWGPAFLVYWVERWPLEDVSTRSL